MFSAPLVIKETGHNRWSVVEPFRFTSESGLVIDVPVGFETDLASVPQVFQGLIGKVGYWSQAAVVHDWLYHRHRLGLDNTVTRKQADKILLEGSIIKAEMYGVQGGDNRHAVMYQGVRLGGLMTWETPQERSDRISTGDDEFLDG